MLISIWHSELCIPVRVRYIYIPGRWVRDTTTWFFDFFSQNLTFLDQSNVGCITTFCWGNFWSPDLWYNPLVPGPVTWCNPHPPRADPQFTCPWHHWAAIKSIHFDWSWVLLIFFIFCFSRGSLWSWSISIQSESPPCGIPQSPALHLSPWWPGLPDISPTKAKQARV